MIDVQAEHLIPLSRAGAYIPGRAGKPTSRATLWRWAMKGRRGVRLASVLLAERMTSIEAVQRFIAQLNNNVPTVKSAERNRAAERVDHLLSAEGF